MSEQQDRRIGIRHADGKRTFPAVTLSGQRYSQPAAATASLGKGSGKFVVLDAYAPKDFDVEAELAALRSQHATAPSGRKAKEQASDAVKPE